MNKKKQVIFGFGDGRVVPVESWCPFVVTEAVSDRPIWWHYLTVTIPDKINYTNGAFMLIDGGNNNEE